MQYLYRKCNESLFVSLQPEGLYDIHNSAEGGYEVIAVPGPIDCPTSNNLGVFHIIFR